MIEKNYDSKICSKVGMGQALEKSWLSTTHPETAKRKYDNFLKENEPDLMILLGSPDQETSEIRARGLSSNLAYFSEKYDDLNTDILTPEEELEWNRDLLEDIAIEYSTDIHISEDYLNDLETTIDDVIAADNATDEGDNLVYHTTSAHSTAVDSAVEKVHGGNRDVSILRFGNDTLFDHMKQRFNGILQEHYWPRRRRDF